MSKVKWFNDKVVYKLTKGENPFENKFFSFYSSDKLLEKNFIIHVIDEETIEIKGDFYEDISMKVGDVKYLFNIVQIEEPNYAGVNNQPVEISDELTVDGKFKITSDDNSITIQNLTSELLKVKVEQFTDEIYPDFPYKKYTREISDIHTITKETNVIYRLLIDKKYYVIKEEPRYYWSNVKDLKEFLDNLKLTYTEKTAERFKRMIMEKSTYLKRRFGLVKIHIEDIEYFPLYKRLVNLYCLQELMTLNFINGVNEQTSSLNYAGVNSGNSLKLGNFQIGEDGGLTGTVFGPEAVRVMIENAEKELQLALFKEQGKAYRATFKGGVYCAKQIFTRI